MKTKDVIYRSVCLMAVYLLFYAVPIVVINHIKHLPGRIDNLCFFLPQYAFPFDRLQLGSDSSVPYMFSKYTAWLITVLYFILLSVLFSKLTASVKKFRWLIPLAFLFCMLSITLLNVIFLACGITVYLNVP